MVKVQFLGPMGIPPRELEASSLAELGAILRSDEQVAHWLSECAVAVNDLLVSAPEHPLREGDVVSILPPVCGG